MALKGSNAPEQIWNYLMDKGLGSLNTAAIMGNLAQESGYDPTRVNEIGATGICQWLDGRKSNLESFASQNGKDVFDLEVQLDFMWNELNGAESAAFTEICNAQSLEDKTVACRVYYERPGKNEANDPNRIKNAKEVFEKQGKGIVVTATCNGPSAAARGLGFGKVGYGFMVSPAGPEMVKITKLPNGKTNPCEPIYPDLITVSDTVPQWILDATIVEVNKQAEEEFRNGGAASNTADKKDSKALQKEMEELKDKSSTAQKKWLDMREQYMKGYNSSSYYDKSKMYDKDYIRDAWTKLGYDMKAYDAAESEYEELNKKYTEATKAYTDSVAKK